MAEQRQGEGEAEKRDAILLKMLKTPPEPKGAGSKPSSKRKSKTPAKRMMRRVKQA